MDPVFLAPNEDVLRVSIQPLESGALDTQPASVSVEVKVIEEDARALERDQSRDEHPNPNREFEQREGRGRGESGAFPHRREIHFRDSQGPRNEREEEERRWRRAMDSGRPFGATLGGSDSQRLAAASQNLRFDAHESDTGTLETSSSDSDPHKSDASDEAHHQLDDPRTQGSRDTLERDTLMRESSPESTPRPALSLENGPLPAPVSPDEQTVLEQQQLNGGSHQDLPSDQQAASSLRPQSPSQEPAAGEPERRPRAQSAKRVHFGRPNLEGSDINRKTDRRVSAAESDDGNVLVFVREIPGRNAVVDSDTEESDKERERERDFREQLLAQSSPERIFSQSISQSHERRPNGILKREPTIDGEEATAEEASREKSANQSASHNRSPVHKTVANGTAPSKTTNGTSENQSPSNNPSSSWLASMSDFQNFIQQHSKPLKTPTRSTTEPSTQRVRRPKTSASADAGSSIGLSQSSNGRREKGTRSRASTEPTDSQTASPAFSQKSAPAAVTNGKSKRSAKADREQRTASRQGEDRTGGGGLRAGLGPARSTRPNELGSEFSMSRSLTRTANGSSGGDVSFGGKPGQGRLFETGSTYLLSVNNFRPQPPHPGPASEILPPIHSERERMANRTPRDTSVQWPPAHTSSNGANDTVRGPGPNSALDLSAWNRSIAWHLANGHMKPQTCSISQLW